MKRIIATTFRVLTQTRAAQLLALLALIVALSPAHAQLGKLRLDVNPGNLAGGSCLQYTGSMELVLGSNPPQWYTSSGGVNAIFQLAACDDIEPTWEIESITGWNPNYTTHGHRLNFYQPQIEGILD